MTLFCILKMKIILFQRPCHFPFKSLHYIQQFLNMYAISLIHFITYLVQGMNQYFELNLSPYSTDHHKVVS